VFIFQKSSNVDVSIKKNDYSNLLVGFDNIRNANNRLQQDMKGIGVTDVLLGAGFFKVLWNDVKTGGRGLGPAETALKELSLPYADYFGAYNKLEASYNELKKNPNDRNKAISYTLNLLDYNMSLYKMQTIAQHYEQSNAPGKAVVNGIIFAVDAATIPLMAVGIGMAARGGAVVIDAVGNLILRTGLKEAGKSLAVAWIYSSLKTTGSYYGMKDLEAAYKTFDSDAGEALKKLQPLILAQKNAAAKRGDTEIVQRLGTIYNDNQKLVSEFSSKGVDEGKLVDQFTLTFLGAYLFSGVAFGYF